MTVTARLFARAPGCLPARPLAYGLLLASASPAAPHIHACFPVCLPSKAFYGSIIGILLGIILLASFAGKNGTMDQVGMYAGPCAELGGVARTHGLGRVGRTHLHKSSAVRLCTRPAHCAFLYPLPPPQASPF